jgi:hypothetical protein
MLSPMNSHSTGKSFPCFAILAICLYSGGFASTPDENAALFSPSRTVLTENPEFDRSDLLASDYRQPSVSGFSFLNPNRFAMRQSYSLNFSSGSMGSHSAGMYLNTLSYQLANPLTLSADVGFYTPFYAGTGGLKPRNFQDPSQGSSVIFPHLGLEYRPSKNTTFSLHLFNGQDAAKAYGPSMNPFFHPWAR